MINVNLLQRNGKYYNGNTMKFGVHHQGSDYIVKLEKGGLSVYNEYIVSNLIKLLGYPCQDAYLGIYNGTVVVVVKDFTTKNSTLHSFKDTKQSSEDTDIGSKNYTYNDVLYLIDKHIKMRNDFKEKAKRQFWDMFICDSIFANRDRHWGNWGYLVENGVYKPAPIYDNGASLFPNVGSVINRYVSRKTRKDFLEERVFVFPASLFMVEKSDRCYRTNYYEMFSDLRINRIFAEEVRKIRESFSVRDIFVLSSRVCGSEDLINLPMSIKRFFIEIICLRYACIVCRMDFDKMFKEIEGWL